MLSDMTTNDLARNRTPGHTRRAKQTRAVNDGDRGRPHSIPR